MSNNPVHEYEGQWYFWNEVWADRCGPFKTEEEANEKLLEYLDFLMRNKK